MFRNVYFLCLVWLVDFSLWLNCCILLFKVSWLALMYFALVRLDHFKYIGNWCVVGLKIILVTSPDNCDLFCYSFLNLD